MTKKKKSKETRKQGGRSKNHSVPLK